MGLSEAPGAQWVRRGVDEGEAQGAAGTPPAAQPASPAHGDAAKGAARTVFGMSNSSQEDGTRVPTRARESKSGQGQRLSELPWLHRLPDSMWGGRNQRTIQRPQIVVDRQGWSIVDTYADALTGELLVVGVWDREKRVEKGAVPAGAVCVVGADGAEAYRSAPRSIMMTGQDLDLAAWAASAKLQAAADANGEARFVTFIVRCLGGPGPRAHAEAASPVAAAEGPNWIQLALSPSWHRAGGSSSNSSDGVVPALHVHLERWDRPGGVGERLGLSASLRLAALPDARVLEPSGTGRAFDVAHLRTASTLSAVNAARQRTALCVAPIHGAPPVRQLVEWIEHHRVLGVQHLHFYLGSKPFPKLGSSSTPALEGREPDVIDVLGAYADAGVVTLHDWTHATVEHGGFYALPQGYFGQMSAIHDCLFSARRQAEWVFVHDIDEWLVVGDRSKPDVSEAATLLLMEAAFPSRGGGDASSTTTVGRERACLTILSEPYCLEPGAAFDNVSDTHASRIREVAIGGDGYEGTHVARLLPYKLGDATEIPRHTGTPKTMYRPDAVYCAGPHVPMKAWLDGGLWAQVDDDSARLKHFRAGCLPRSGKGGWPTSALAVDRGAQGFAAATRARVHAAMRLKPVR